MRVLIVNQHPQIALGGSEVQCDLIATEMTRRGHFVVYGAVQEKIIDEQSVEYTVSYIDPKRFFSSLKDYIQKQKPDVIYWRYNKRKLIHGVIAARYREFPLCLLSLILKILFGWNILFSQVLFLISLGI